MLQSLWLEIPRNLKPKQNENFTLTPLQDKRFFSKRIKEHEYNFLRYVASQLR